MNLPGVYYDPSNTGAPWGVALFERDGKPLGFYYGFNSVGSKLWLELVDGAVLNTGRSGTVDPASGVVVITPHSDGSLDFHMTVPRGWTHPVDTSPSPDSTTIRARLTRVF